jgi:ferrous iron transport protein A
MEDTGAGTGLTLCAVRGGESARIRRLAGGQAFLGRLAPLGFIPGARLQVIQNLGRGPLLVAVCGARVALGRGEADKILVERLAGKKEDDGIAALDTAG